MRIHQIPTVLLKDFYKVGHPFQYPKGTSMVYSNFTPRSTHRKDGMGKVVAFGYQYFVKEYLIDQFNENFFRRDKEIVVGEYERIVRNALGPTPVDHIAALHDVGYLPLEIKAIPEGSLVPYRVPALTIRNTMPAFYWLTNMVETLMSNVLWLPATSATTAFLYRRRFQSYARQTGADLSFVPWQGHDFSMRGMAGIEAACLSGAAHLTCFTGTDSIPAIPFLEEYYGANSDVELVGGSVPATEHSVMCMGLKENEDGTYDRLTIEVYPTGIVSIVSDTWDFGRILTEYLPSRREQILARDGKLVIRPDSGDPVKIICGDPEAPVGSWQRKGAIQCLWDVFGGTFSSTGHKVLDSHIGLIYGDSITPERQKEILQQLMLNGFASSNVVLGIGSYTYQYVTRDTDGWAMKATYGEKQISILPSPVSSVHTIETEAFEIFKAPKTDDGTKNSAKGLLSVHAVNGELALFESQTWEQEKLSALDVIFKNGVRHNVTALKDVRRRIEARL